MDNKLTGDIQSDVEVKDILKYFPQQYREATRFFSSKNKSPDSLKFKINISYVNGHAVLGEIWATHPKMKKEAYMMTLHVRFFKKYIKNQKILRNTFGESYGHADQSKSNGKQ